MRWHIMYNLVVLRLVSFGMDLHWARRGAAASKTTPPPQRQPRPAVQDSRKVRREGCGHRWRTEKLCTASALVE